VQATYTYKTG